MRTKAVDRATSDTPDMGVRINETLRSLDIPNERIAERILLHAAALRSTASSRAETRKRSGLETPMAPNGWLTDPEGTRIGGYKIVETDIGGGQSIHSLLTKLELDASTDTLNHTGYEIGIRGHSDDGFLGLVADDDETIAAALCTDGSEDVHGLTMERFGRLTERMALHLALIGVPQATILGPMPRRTSPSVRLVDDVPDPRDHPDMPDWLHEAIDPARAWNPAVTLGAYSVPSLSGAGIGTTGIIIRCLNARVRALTDPVEILRASSKT
jgi:hypothetical protein